MSMGFWHNACMCVCMCERACAVCVLQHTSIQARCCTTLTHDVCTMLLYARVGYILCMCVSKAFHAHSHKHTHEFSSNVLYMHSPKCELFFSYHFYHTQSTCTWKNPKLLLRLWMWLCVGLRCISPQNFTDRTFHCDSRASDDWLTLLNHTFSHSTAHIFNTRNYSHTPQGSNIWIIWGEFSFLRSLLPFFVHFLFS